MLSAVYSILAFLPPLVLALFLAVGWLATAHVTYDATTSRVPAPALRLVQLFDRILAGQVIIFYGFARYAAMLREFLAGLVNLGVHEREEAAAASGTPATPLAAGSPLGGWLAKAMKAATTASRVQSRMYGHVVREIAFNTGEPAGTEAGEGPSTPTTPIAGLLGMMLRGPMGSAASPTVRRPGQGNRLVPVRRLQPAAATVALAEPEAAAGRSAMANAARSPPRVLPPLLATDQVEEAPRPAAAAAASVQPPWGQDDSDSDSDTEHQQGRDLDEGANVTWTVQGEREGEGEEGVERVERVAVPSAIDAFLDTVGGSG